ncbi:MAG TPA: DUF4440 domain-containing protein [Kiritimatiellia bacterium]|nr:DUF4440 domain-containing protein [Kiritimatiellia bacterium]HMP32955.1 DUF4440 domain-containing protein [Kiritimatiellia bacterium]
MLSRWYKGWLLALVVAPVFAFPVVAQEIRRAEVNVFLGQWIEALRAFDFNRLTALIAEDAQISLTHPVSREVQPFTREAYIDALRPLQGTYTAVDFVVDDQLVRIDGDLAVVRLRGRQIVTQLHRTTERGSTSRFILRRSGEHLLIQQAVIVPDDWADYRQP